MGLNDDLPNGATPLDADELHGLIPTHLVSRNQLNEWEERNIQAALSWIERQRRLRPLEEAWLRRLHRVHCSEPPCWVLIEPPPKTAAH